MWKCRFLCPISRESDSSGPGRDLGVCILTSSLGKPAQQALSLALASAGRVEWSLAVLGGLPHPLEVLGECFGV